MLPLILLSASIRFGRTLRFPWAKPQPRAKQDVSHEGVATNLLGEASI